MHEVPQWVLDESMSTHPVPQSAVPLGQAQLPLQVVPFWQMMPQPPQLELSLLKSRQVPPQQCPLWHCPLTWHVVALLVAIFVLQLPPTQAWPCDVQLVVVDAQEPCELHAPATLDP